MAYFQNEIALVAQKALSLLKEKERILIAIDGRCTSGKTTLAKALSQVLDVPFVSCDDFFLPKEKRTTERLAEIGGNMERERLFSEVIEPFLQRKSVSYSPFVCKTLSYGDAISLPPSKILIIEGSYSCHADLWQYYDLHIFLDVSQEEQRQRILKRNPKNANDFFTKWIPLEERYFQDGSVKEKADIILS